VGEGENFIKVGKQKENSRHFLMKNWHMLPYLDDEFLEVARTSQDS